MKGWCLLLVVGASGLIPPLAAPRRVATVVSSSDPTKVWYADVANAVQNVLTNSPLNEAKKAVVKLLAGPYDAAAVRAKLDGLIETEPVLFLSFTK